MKKKLLFLFGLMASIALAGTFIIILFSSKPVTTPVQGKDKLKVVATFYPVYLIGMNLADASENMEVKSLTELNTGCLHDYQLTTEDMKLISDADILIINGGGMESFLSDVRANYPKLTIIDASLGVAMLNEGSDTEYNAHVWLDPERYMEQIENVRDGLLDYISTAQGFSFSSSVLENEITQNAETYLGKVQKLSQEFKDSFSNQEKPASDAAKAVIFHDSFAYLADKVGIEVAFSVPLDSDTTLSAGEIATIIDSVKKDNIKYLFTELQYSDSIAKQIEAETGAKVFIINSVVTGSGEKDSYLNDMRSNLEVIREAVGE